MIFLNWCDSVASICNYTKGFKKFLKTIYLFRKKPHYILSKEKREDKNMKSSLNREAFSNWLTVANMEEKNKMMAAGAMYGAYMKKDDEEKMTISYGALHKQVAQAEEKYGIQFVDSPDQNYYRAFLMISDWANKVLVEIQKQKNQIYKAYFGNVKEASNWLLNNKVDVVSMELETGTGLGFFANHTTIKRIALNYRKNEKTKYFYNIFEEEELGLLIKKNTNKVAEKWKERHPELEVISQRFFTNARGEMLSMAIGFGNYAENLKIVTLCRGVRQ